MLSAKAKALVSNSRFVDFFSFAIVASGIVLGIQTELDVPC
jgi:hypothetical protein